MLQFFITVAVGIILIAVLVNTFRAMGRREEEAVLAREAALAGPPPAPSIAPAPDLPPVAEAAEAVPGEMADAMAAAAMADAIEETANDLYTGDEVLLDIWAQAKTDQEKAQILTFAQENMSDEEFGALLQFLRLHPDGKVEPEAPAVAPAPAAAVVSELAFDDPTFDNTLSQTLVAELPKSGADDPLGVTVTDDADWGMAFASPGEAAPAPAAPIIEAELVPDVAPEPVAAPAPPVAFFGEEEYGLEEDAGYTPELEESVELERPVSPVAAASASQPQPEPAPENVPEDDFEDNDPVKVAFRAELNKEVAPSESYEEKIARLDKLFAEQMAAIEEARQEIKTLTKERDQLRYRGDF